jgi:WD40 repeat protein
MERPGFDLSIRMWDVATGKELRRFSGHKSWVVSVAFSPDGRQAVSGGHDCTIRTWDVNSGKEVAQFKGHQAAVWSVAYSPNGKSILSASDDGTVRLWDAVSGKELSRFRTRRSLFALRASGIPPCVLTGFAPVWMLRYAMEEVCWALGGHAEVTSIAFSPDGRLAVSGNYRGVVQLWDVTTGKEVRRFSGHRAAVHSVAFSPDGRQIASGAGGLTEEGKPIDNTIRVWDVKSGKEIKCMDGHKAEIYSVAFSPDGGRLLSCGGSLSWGFEEKDGRMWRPLDCTVRLWDLATGKELYTFDGHKDRVTSVVFTPDGKYALSGSLDQTARLWRLPPAGKGKEQD